MQERASDSPLIVVKLHKYESYAAAAAGAMGETPDRETDSSPTSSQSGGSVITESDLETDGRTSGSAVIPKEFPEANGDGVFGRPEELGQLVWLVWESCFSLVKHSMHAEELQGRNFLFRQFLTLVWLRHKERGRL